MRYVFILFFISNFVYSQSDNRTWIRGKVLYKNSNVISANVVNNTSRQATITDGDGEFEMLVKLNDRLVFSSVQYQIRSVVINKEILQKIDLEMYTSATVGLLTLKDIISEMNAINKGVESGAIQIDDEIRAYLTSLRKRLEEMRSQTGTGFVASESPTGGDFLDNREIA